MTANDFHLEGDEWHGPSFETSHGKFGVRLFSESDLERPDPKMIEIANTACDYVKKEADIVAKILFTYFTEIIRLWGKETVEANFGPVDQVTVSNVIALHEGGDIHVVKDEFDIFCQIIFEAVYDPEHGLQMTFTDGEITEIGDFQVSVEDGQVSLA